MKKTGRRFLAFMLILSMVLVYSQAVFAYDFSGAQPKTVALEGVSGYAPYGGTAKIGLTWSTNDPAKLVGGLFNLIKKDGSDIPALSKRTSDLFYSFFRLRQIILYLFNFQHYKYLFFIIIFYCCLDF